MKKNYGYSIVSKIQAEQLLQKYGSPLYLYDADIIKQKARQLIKAAQGFHVSYAMKANNNSHILKILREQGINSVDVVSPGQAFKALQCGYKPQQILYTQNFISSQQLSFSLQKNITLNIGAIDTLRNYCNLLQNKQIFIRINPQLGAGQTYQVITGGPKSKFGIYYDQIQQVLLLAKQNNIQIIGLHQHIGSNLKEKDQNVFVDTVKYIFQMAKKFKDLKYVNIGGGVGIQYKKDEKCMDIAKVYDRVRQIKQNHFKQTGNDIGIWIEPGRFLVGDCGILLCKITAKKRTPERIFYGTDTGFNHLIRPTLYGSHHEIYNISRSQAQKQIVTVCGNICECSDNLGTNIHLGGQIDDILCIQNTGAYGYAMSMNYNERLKPAEILKEGQTFRVIRRRQTYEDLMQKV